MCVCVENASSDGGAGQGEVSYVILTLCGRRGASSTCCFGGVLVVAFWWCFGSCFLVMVLW